MSRLIVKQPDGSYACWETALNDFVFRDVDKTQYAVTRAMEQYERTKEETLDTFKELEELEKEKPDIYSDHPACIGFKECVRAIREREETTKNYIEHIKNCKEILGFITRRRK